MFDRAAPTYGQVGPDFFSALGDLLVERASVSVGSNVIDVGAGTGAVTQAAAVRLGSSGSLLAIDLAPQMLAQLRRRLDGRVSVSLATSVMDAGFLGVRASSFDVALSGIALQSMADPSAAAAEMCRVIRPGGTFGISISKGWWWEEDPRWQWHADLLRGLGIACEDPPPSSGQEFIDQLLSGMPLSNIQRTREMLEFEFDGAETFWEWCWSHGWRSVMERLTEEQQNDYLRGVRGSIGGDPFPGHLVAHLATAVRK